MKALALALMLVNHLIAPLVSPWLAILTGETARFLLIAVFCAPSRFRPTGYWRHARKLSLALLATLAMVATLDYFHQAEASTFVQMPVAWLMLLWLRPVIFEHPFRSAYAGVLVWGAGIAVFLQNPESTGITAWLSGLNLFAAGLIFPSLKKSIPPKLPLPLVITTAMVYAAASLISIGLGATSQLDNFS